MLYVIKKFIAIRKNHKILFNGTYETLLAKKEQYAFMGSTTYKTIIIIVNAFSNHITVKLNKRGLSQRVFRDILNDDYCLTCLKTAISIKVSSC